MDNLDQEKQKNNYSLLKRSPNYQNHYHLSNVVKQILEMKPKTAAVASQNSSRNHKTQIITDFKPNLQFFTHKYKRNHQNDQGLDVNAQKNTYKNSLSKQKRYQNYDGNRINSNKIVVSKSSRELKAEINLADAIYSYKNIGQIKAKQNQALKKVQIISKTHDNQCRIRITKRKIEFSAPKSKITITNIDSMIDVEPRKTISRSKPAQKYDLNLPKPNIITKQFKEDQLSDIKLWKQKKSKKSLNEIKVPQFIKASLQIYQQEPIYFIEQLQKRKKRQSYAQREQKSDEFNEANLEQYQMVAQKQAIQDQNKLASRMKLLQKQKKKSILYVQSSQQLVQNATISQERIQKKPLKSKRKDQIEQKINICGWQQQAQPNTAYFQF